MSKIKNKKRLSTLAIVLAIVFAAGVVYAAAAGALTFQGNVNLDPNVSLVLTSAIDNDPRVSISSDGQSATFTIQLPDENANEVVGLRVTNNGNIDAKTADDIRDYFASQAVVITGYDDIEGESIAIGDHIDFSLDFSLDETHIGDLTVFTFTFLLDYEIDAP